MHLKQITSITRMQGRLKFTLPAHKFFTSKYNTGSGSGITGRISLIYAFSILD
jgi:hypothetical protein